MSGLLDIPVEIRLQIYSFALNMGDLPRNYEVSYGFNQEARYHKICPHFARRAERHIPKRASALPKHLSTLASLNRMIRDEVYDAVYGSSTFTIRLGVRSVPQSPDDDIWRPMPTGPREARKIVCRRDHHISPIETAVLGSLSKLSLHFSELLYDAENRRRVCASIASVVKILSQRRIKLKQLTIHWEALVRVGYHIFAAIAEGYSQYQYLLEPFTTIRADQATVEGTVEPDFGYKLAAVIQGEHDQPLTKVDYGVQKFAKRPRGRVRKRQVERSRRSYYQPLYDWARVGAGGANQSGPSTIEASTSSSW